MIRLIGGIITGLALFFITGCEDKQESKLFEAQVCLDRATPQTALSCSDLVAGQTSKRAYVIVCSARFLARGLDETKIVAALEQISKEGGTNPTSTAIANLAVMNDAENPTAYDPTFAQDTLTACNLTESPGLIALASFSSIATTVGGLASAESCIDASPASGEPFTVDQACMQTQIGLTGSTGDATTIGQTAVANQQILCGTDGIFKGKSFCTDLDAAIAAGGTADTIGDAILNGIKGD